MSMNGIPGMEGNEHTQWAKNLYEKFMGKTDTDRAVNIDRILAAAQIQATLALAYEQRTANLIATLRVGAVDMTDWPQPVIDNFHRTSQEIAQRMGYPIGATE